MAIIWNQDDRTLTLQTDGSTYQMKIDNHNVLLHTYYGKKTELFDYSYLIDHRDRGFAGNPYDAEKDKTYTLDTLPQEYPCFGSGDFRNSALKVRYGSGASALELRYLKHEILPGKYRIPGLPSMFADEDKADTLIVTMKGDAAELLVHLYYGVIPGADIITRAVVLENCSSEAIYLEKAMSVSLDFQYGSYDLVTFYGRHCMERNVCREKLRHGIQSVGSTRGASSHQQNPFVILADPGTSEESGDCYGLSFLYSGDFMGEAECDQINQTRVIMGIHPANFRWKLEPGDSFYTPEAALSYSSEGFRKLSWNYHDAIRKHLCRGPYGNDRAPILINNWEGTYFDFTGEKLIEMARDAAELGIEMFVLDDGWFGARNSETGGLGDWYANEKKLGCTIGELAAQIHGLGMKFGLWFEPECVSEDSDLYRAHPDWAFTVPGRKPMRGRYQLVLDFGRSEVREHIFRQMCEVLDQSKADYIKWDFNRSVSDVYSAALTSDRQGEAAHRYVLGLYDILERLLARYPNLLIEGCCGGGGRFDAGMLHYAPQIWCSDNTDAVNRMSIQYGTSFCYPVSTMGAHVSACPNHQTGRIVPFSTRGAVAMAGTFGYELDITKMTAEEKEDVRQQVACFKKYSDVIRNGRYYRLTAPGEKNFHAWEMAKEDGSEALVTVVSTVLEGNPLGSYLKLRGLIPEKIYEVEGWEKRYPGSALMNCGVILPTAQYEYQSWQFHIKAAE